MNAVIDRLYMDLTTAQDMRDWQEAWHTTLKAQVKKVIDSIYDFAKHSRKTEMRFPPNLDPDVIEVLTSLGYKCDKFFSTNGDEDVYYLISW